MAKDFAADIAAIARIEAVPSILDVVCRTTGMGFAAVARVTEDRWIACGVRDEIGFGLEPGGELKVETTICHEIRQKREAVIIDDVAEDAAYCRHPTPTLYGFQSYISVPIILPNGKFFGTLCAIDPRPLRLKSPETIGMFTLFAELIAFHLDAIARLESSAARLRAERKASELREEFIAVLGHDLRNPLSAIAAGAELLELRTPLNDQASRILGRIRKSVDRMSALIDDVLDFARGRFGGGLTLTRNAEEPVESVLDQVIAELRALWPDRPLEAEFILAEPVDCDRGRIGQLFSNLLANALAYGAADAAVRVRAATGGGNFELSVSNAGAPIPRTVRKHLFQPFTRGARGPGQDGLGLGLYIAAEIARAHGGTLDVQSSAVETRFTFRMPLA